MQINILLQWLKKTLFPGFIIFFIIMSCVVPFGCRTTENGLELLTGDFTVPELLDFKTISSNTLSLKFSKEVSLNNCYVETESDKDKRIEVNICENIEGCILLTMNECTELGKKYTLNSFVKDSNGNSLMLNIDFKGFNDNPAELIFSEVRNSYGDVSINNVKYKRAEFVEFYVLKEGNLSGLYFLSASDGEAKAYYFNSIQVCKGEYITLHLRSKLSKTDDYIEEGVADENDTDLTLSKTSESCDTARDLWVDNNSARLGNSDVLMIINGNTDKIQDALLYKVSTDETYEQNFASYLTKINEESLWKNSNPVESDNLTSSAVTRTLSRQNIEEIAFEWNKGNYVKDNGSSYWIITKNVKQKGVTSYGATPGYKNSSNAY